MLDLRGTAGVEPESVDLCVAVYAVCCLENRDQLNRAFREIYQSLKPGGNAIIQIPQPLESYFKVSSLWAMDENPPENYYASGRVVFRNLKTVGGGRLRVARHHFTLSDYFNAVILSGLSLKQVIEPRPSDRLVAQYIDLKRESQLPFSIILLAQRNASELISS
jgi:SAM-dependent methyltransferase